MERNLNNEDFEDFLKLKTDNYKLYPSDKVWRGIYQSIHTRKRWFQIGGSILFLSALLFVSYEFNNHGQKAILPDQTKSPTTKGIVNSPVTTGIITPATSEVEARAVVPSSKKLPATTATVKRSANRNISPTSVTETSIHTTRSIAPIEIAEDPQVEEMTKEPLETGETESGLPRADEVINDDERVPDTETVTQSTEAEVAVHESERVPHDRNEINWLQEMAALRLTTGRRNRFNLQFYFSPTISYRKLADGNTSKELSNVPLATNQLAINNFVDHKPAIGLELGTNVLFSPSKKLTLKTGLQLNYSRYTIKAYKFFSEKANIALLSSGRTADTMSSYTSIRNFSGYFPEQLQNQYLQLSLPIGAELKLIGSKRLQLNIAGSIQPSYLVYNDTYLLSTDFINYTKEPSLVRKWNVNTSAEAFVSYYIGGMRWQIGPQFRYQTLSSYNDRYPIKEYLFEYGVKFGVSKTLR